MKKILITFVLFCCTFTAFAGKYGLDITLGGGWGFQSVGLENLQEFNSNNTNEKNIYPQVDFTRNDFTVDLKVSSYNFFLVNDMLGAFTTVSICPMGGFLFEKLNVNGEKANAAAESGFNEAVTLWEFAIGPAFGIDCGSPDIRFQKGLGFHFLGGMTSTKAVMGYDNCYEDFIMLGLAVTPQVRIGNTKRVCFVAGCDLIFDFYYTSNRDKFYVENEYGIGSMETSNYTESLSDFFRFAVRPHVGIGINF